MFNWLNLAVLIAEYEQLATGQSLLSTFPAVPFEIVGFSREMNRLMVDNIRVGTDPVFRLIRPRDALALGLN